MGIGGRLLKQVQQIELICNSPVFMWTDSEIVLHWLRKPCNELKIFVANRVLKILAVVKIEQCNHVSSGNNPADLLSRGAHVETLLNHSLWWNGPELLQHNVDTWPPWQPRHDIRTSEIVGSGIRRPPTHFDTVLLTTKIDDGTETNLIERWSSYHKTCRVTAYVFRFLHLTSRKLTIHRAPKSHWLYEYNKDDWKSAAFTTISVGNEQFCTHRPPLREQAIALNFWVKLSQCATFPTELKAVANHQPVDKKSVLYNFTPQIDDDRILRICGRLGNSDLPYAVKHPIILSRTSTLAQLLAQEAHQLLCHGGVQLCTQYLRNKFWIVGVRILLRNVVQRCVTCTRYRQQTERQFMADLPKQRLTRLAIMEQISSVERASNEKPHNHGKTIAWLNIWRSTQLNGTTSYHTLHTTAVCGSQW